MAGQFALLKQHSAAQVTHFARMSVDTLPPPDQYRRSAACIGGVSRGLWRPKTGSGPLSGGRRYRLCVEREAIYRNPATAEFQPWKAYLAALPGAQLKDDLDALHSCSYTFGQNAHKLPIASLKGAR